MSRPAQVAGLALALVAAACSSSSGQPVVHPARTVSPSSATSSSPSVQRQILRTRVAGRLRQPVSRAVAVRAGGRILVLGGLTTGDVTTGRVLTVDSRRWLSRFSGQLRQPVHDASGAWLGGRAVVFGGGSATEVADTQQWTGRTSRVIGSLPSPRSDSAAVTIGGNAYVVGGFDGSRMTRTVLATKTGRSFRTVARLRQGVRYPAVAAYDGSIYVFGGQLATTEGTSGSAQSRLVQRIDPATGRTRIVGRLPWGIGHAMAFTLDGRLYLAGGRRGTRATARIWQVEPATARLTPAGRLPHPISDSAVVKLGDSFALVGGETTGPFAPQTTIVQVSPGR